MCVILHYGALTCSSSLRCRTLSSVERARSLIFATSFYSEDGNKFDRNLVLVVGNTSIQSARSHPSTLGAELRSALRRQRFKVLLIDEFGTSRNCSECHSSVKNSKFPLRKSPRPWRRHFPKQKIHGVFRCNSQQCEI